MARSDRYNRNLSKVQDMLDGNYKNKIQVGYSTNDVTRKVGDRWTDSDGVEWEQKEGYYSKVSKVNLGIFRHECKDCKSGLTKSFDVDTSKRYGRCYNCQTIWEQDLQFLKKNRIGKNGNKWQFWVRLQELQRWISGRKELEQWIEEQHKIQNEKVYDESVANALANSNVDTSMKIHKKLTQ